MKKTIVSRLEALEREVFKKEEWRLNDEYFFIDEEGRILDSQWDSGGMDENRRDFLGIFHTKAEAEARLEAIKNFLKTL
jgi:hypothetical protein